MSNFWADHWWLLIPLGAFTIPLAGIAMGAFATWQHYRSRNRALEALKVYAQQGKEPPEELLRAVGGARDLRWEWQQRWADEVRDTATDGAAQGRRYAGRWSDPEAIRARTEYYTARATARAARWRSREPVRRWNNAIFLVVGAGALYYAAQHYAADHILSDRLYIGAIIVGALAAAAVLAAVLATLFRPQ
jgi:hypothetical protein